MKSEDIKDAVKFLVNQGLPLKEDSNEWTVRFDSGEEYNLLALFCLYAAKHTQINHSNMMSFVYWINASGWCPAANSTQWNKSIGANQTITRTTDQLYLEYLAEV